MNRFGKSFARASYFKTSRTKCSEARNNISRKKATKNFTIYIVYCMAFILFAETLTVIPHIKQT